MATVRAFWVPFSAEVGLGHFYRCLALYERVRKPAVFLTADFPPTDLASRFPIRRVDGFSGLTPEFLRAEGIGTLLVDDYAFPDVELDRLARIPGIHLVYQDEFFRNPRVAAIWNANLYASESEYPRMRPETRYFLGPKYYGIRGEIIAVGAREIERDLAVCFGGSDPNRLTEQVIPLIPKEWTARIFLGAGVDEDRVARIRGLVDRDSIEIFRDPPNFACRFAACERAIVSASSLAYEAAALGLPFLAVELAANQNRLAQALNTRGILVRNREAFGESIAGEIRDPGAYRRLEVEIGASITGLVSELDL